MARFLVVTATNTGVGKTLVSAGLARALAARGERVLAIKPFETGLVEDEKGDGEALAEATGQAQPRRALVRLREPLTPALAAERQGVSVDVEQVVARIRALSVNADTVIVEGAGGVLSPITWTADITTLARALGTAEVILVAADELGTLSLTHTAVFYLAQLGLEPSTIILSEPARRDLSTGTNAAVLRRRLADLGRGGENIVELRRVADATEAAGVLATVLR